MLYYLLSDFLRFSWSFQLVSKCISMLFATLCFSLRNRCLHFFFFFFLLSSCMERHTTNLALTAAGMAAGVLSRERRNEFPAKVSGKPYSQDPLSQPALQLTFRSWRRVKSYGWKSFKLKLNLFRECYSAAVSVIVVCFGSFRGVKKKQSEHVISAVQCGGRGCKLKSIFGILSQMCENHKSI